MEIGQLVINLISLSVIIEGLVKGVTKPITFPEKYNEPIKKLMGVVLGILIAFGFNVDYSGILNFEPVYEWIGLLFTGFTAGLGSSLLHDIFDKYLRS